MWRRSKTDKPEIDWPAIERELREKVGEIESYINHPNVGPVIEQP